MIYSEFVLSWTCESTFLVNPLLQKPLHTRMFVCFSLIWDQDLTSISAKFISFLFSEHEIDDRSSTRVSSVSWMMSFPVRTKFFHHITLGKTQITYSFPSSCTNTNQSSSMHHIQIFERGVMPTDGSNQKCLVFCLKSCHKEGKYSQNLSAARLLETSVKDTADRCLFFLIGTVAIAMGLKLGWETESWIKARCPRAPPRSSVWVRWRSRNTSNHQAAEGNMKGWWEAPFVSSPSLPEHVYLQEVKTNSSPSDAWYDGW